MRSARKAKNWTISDVVKATGIDPATISRVERGKQWPSRDTLVAILAAFPELDERQVLFPFEDEAA